jgi:5-methylcytosine-specific restriction endonuclease McrA
MYHPRYKYCSPKCKDTFNKSKPEYKQARNLYAKKKNSENPEARKLRDKKRYLENREQFYESNAKRRYKIRDRSTPKWDEELTSFVFQEAQRLRKLRDACTGIEWHVDHIIPVSGNDVSGLHVWNNFAVIPKVDNLRKGNKNSVYA